MKKFLITSFCLLSLLIITDIRSEITTMVQKPEITSIDPVKNFNQFI